MDYSDYSSYVDNGATYNRVKDLKGVFAFEKFPTYEQMSNFLVDELRIEQIPYLDRPNIDESKLSDDQLFWRRQGYLLIRNAIPESLIDAYLAVRVKAGLVHQGWPSIYAYESIPEIRELCLYQPLLRRIEKMVGYEIVMAHNLSTFTSSERGWHMDDTMADPPAAASGIGLWYALGDILPESGPLEFVPGSHRWPILRMHKVACHLTTEALYNKEGKYEYWGQLVEYFVNPACDAYLRKRNVTPKVFLPKKGDVLVMHGALLHRGSVPTNRDLLRPAIITQFIDPKRNPWGLQGGKVVRHSNGQGYVLHPGSSQPSRKGKSLSGLLASFLRKTVKPIVLGR